MCSHLCPVTAWKLGQGRDPTQVWVRRLSRSEPGKRGLGADPGPLADDLPRPAVARHAGLRGPSVAAHLKADDMLALLQLALCEFPLVLLGFPKEKEAGESVGKTAWFHLLAVSSGTP